jgi:hypothetical protein
VPNLSALIESLEEAQVGIEDVRIRVRTQLEVAEIVACLRSVAGQAWQERESADRLTRGELSDGKNLVEVEVEPRSLRFRFSVCHEDSIDGMFVPLVMSAARCVQGLIQIEEDLEPEWPDEFRAPFDGVEAGYLHAVRAKRMNWDVHFHGRRNGLRCGEALRVFIP